ncbi:MAG: methyltransferase domain-containing protein [Methanocorpusculum sp.]|nr:methyltransferase domain-containing protein [Methanocorpusculum sp.]
MNDTPQWCIKVPVQEGEAMRRRLIAEGAVDRTLRPRAEDGLLFIPLCAPREGAMQELFAKTHAREELPRHEQVGGLVILQDDDPEGAARILANRPNVHTALFATSPVEGEFRTRSFKVLAGRDTTETLYTEYGKRMTVDLTAAYFSARLSNERQRLLSLMHDGEMVLDMFAGVGPFAVMLGGRAGFMVANDINPSAVYLMQKNLRMNRISNVAATLGDAKHLPEMLAPLKFDRIIMNLPFAAYAFLEAAAKLAKPHAVIHLYSLVEREGEHTEDILRAFPGARITEKFIRSYSPTSWHAVYDIEAGV